MVNMEVDDMELDAGTMEIDQGRRQRAAQKLCNRLAPHRQGESITAAKARDILKHLSDLACGNKISVENAFDLQGIDALRTIVFSETAKASALCGEGHFQSAGAGLDISVKIYGKRVDATYNLALSIGGGSRKDARKDDADEDDDGQGEGQGQGDAEAEGGEDGAARGARGKKRQGSANAEATLVEDSELKTRVKEPTFDTDPFFVRTSRLIDENNPQGLLLHNLPVLCGFNIIFDANIRPQVLLARAHDNARPEGPAEDVMVDLTMLPGARECLAAAAAESTSISPGIEQLYRLLQAELDLPGLQIARSVDPGKLLREALAANSQALMEKHRNRAVRQVVQQVEDAMDVDTGAGGGVAAEAEDRGDHDAGRLDGAADDDEGTGGPDLRSLHDGDNSGGDYGVGGAGDDGFDNGYDSPGYGGGDDDYDEAPGGSGGAAPGGRQRGGDSGINEKERAANTTSDNDEEAGAEHGGKGGASDDESALFSWLASSHLTGGTSATNSLQTWWKSRARKPSGAKGAAKPRARKPKPEFEPLDWRAASLKPDLEAVQFHTYKTARRDVSAKLCLPLEEPPQPDALICAFSAAPAVSDLGYTGCGRGAGILGVLGEPLSGAWGAGGSGGGFACSVQETWRQLLLAERKRLQQLQRGVAARKSLGAAAGIGGGAAVAGGRHVDLPSASGTDGGLFGGGGEEYCAGAQDGGIDDAADLDDGGDGGGYGGDYDGGDGDEDDVSGGGGSGGGHGMPYMTLDGRGPTLEELLQPPRRVRRLTIKYDRTAGVADVATLKANIEVSLKELAGAAVSQRRQSAPQAQLPLSFQSVLDQVSAKGGCGCGPSQGDRRNAAAAQGAIQGPPPSSGGGCPAGFLSGVTTHLAFICLLHLANERGLALRSSEQLDALMITGLGDLALVQEELRAATARY